MPILLKTVRMLRYGGSGESRLSAKSLQRCQVRGGIRGELAAGLRSFPVGAYLIFYRQIEGGIQITRVLHGARDIASLFS
jgi:plasmid stabilization system protein ParE